VLGLSHFFPVRCLGFPPRLFETFCSNPFQRRPLLRGVQPQQTGIPWIVPPYTFFPLFFLLFSSLVFPSGLPSILSSAAKLKCVPLVSFRVVFLTS